MGACIRALASIAKQHFYTTAALLSLEWKPAASAQQDISAAVALHSVKERRVIIIVRRLIHQRLSLLLENSYISFVINSINIFIVINLSERHANRAPVSGGIAR